MTLVECKFRIPGFHQWPGAPDEVAFLRDKHRHLFGFRVRVSVMDSDREVEFFLMRKRVQEVVQREYPTSENMLGFDFGSNSCEMIATHVSNMLTMEGYAVRSVWVDEDGECSGGFEQ